MCGICVFLFMMQHFIHHNTSQLDGCVDVSLGDVCDNMARTLEAISLYLVA